MKMNPIMMPGSESGRMTSRKTLNGEAPRSLAASTALVVDRRQLEEDRRHHEQHVQLHERQVDREVRVEQEVEGSEAELAREVVDRAVLAEHRGSRR